jgi:hypothetical protein
MMNGLENQHSLTVRDPRTYDVLFGRGRSNMEHHGNVVLQGIVKLERTRYQKAQRNHRLKIVQEILQHMKQGGPNREPARFLKRIDTADGWVEVSDAEAIEKVSHALRAKILKKQGNTEASKPVEYPGQSLYDSQSGLRSYHQSINQQQSQETSMMYPAFTGAAGQIPTNLSLEIANGIVHPGTTTLSSKVPSQANHQSTQSTMNLTGSFEERHSIYGVVDRLASEQSDISSSLLAAGHPAVLSSQVPSSTLHSGFPRDWTTFQSHSSIPHSASLPGSILHSGVGDFPRDWSTFQSHSSIPHSASLPGSMQHARSPFLGNPSAPLNNSHPPTIQSRDYVHGIHEINPTHLLSVTTHPTFAQPSSSVPESHEIYPSYLNPGPSLQIQPYQGSPHINGIVEPESVHYSGIPQMAMQLYLLTTENDEEVDEESSCHQS